jgi:hypothetical protein
VTLVGIGLVLALASAGRMYASTAEGRRRRLRADVFGTSPPGPAFYVDALGRV